MFALLSYPDKKDKILYQEKSWSHFFCKSVRWQWLWGIVWYVTYKSSTTFFTLLELTEFVNKEEVKWCSCDIKEWRMYYVIGQNIVLNYYLYLHVVSVWLLYLSLQLLRVSFNTNCIIVWRTLGLRYFFIIMLNVRLQ